MYIKAKYPKTERWYMNIETQGYGSGKNQNNATITNQDTIHSIDEDRASAFPN